MSSMNYIRMKTLRVVEGIMCDSSVKTSSLDKMKRLKYTRITIRGIIRNGRYLNSHTDDYFCFKKKPFTYCTYSMSYYRWYLYPSESVKSVIAEG